VSGEGRAVAAPPPTTSLVRPRPTWRHCRDSPIPTEHAVLSQFFPPEPGPTPLVLHMNNVRRQVARRVESREREMAHAVRAPPIGRGQRPDPVQRSAGIPARTLVRCRDQIGAQPPPKCCWPAQMPPQRNDSAAGDEPRSQGHSIPDTEQPGRGTFRDHRVLSRWRSRSAPRLPAVHLSHPVPQLGRESLEQSRLVDTRVDDATVQNVHPDLPLVEHLSEGVYPCGLSLLLFREVGPQVLRIRPDGLEQKTAATARPSLQAR